MKPQQRSAREGGDAMEMALFAVETFAHLIIESAAKGKKNQ